jgi:hypothetical protein
MNDVPITTHVLQNLCFREREEEKKEVKMENSCYPHERKCSTMTARKRLVKKKKKRGGAGLFGYSRSSDVFAQANAANAPSHTS